VNKIFVYFSQKKFEKEAKRIFSLAQKIFLLLKKNGLSVEIFLVSDFEIKKINKKYRNKNKATNVLSFCQPKDFVLAPLKKHLGEIYLAPNYIKKNKQDIKLMLVHGILHLLGYDHIKEADRIKMEEKEKSLLKKL